MSIAPTELNKTSTDSSVPIKSHLYRQLLDVTRENTQFRGICGEHYTRLHKKIVLMLIMI